MRATASKDTETLERLLSTRHSCRGFLREPVADDLIVRILSISQRTPSWCNAQPWQVIITKGAATERFRTALCDYVARNPLLLTWPFRVNIAALISSGGG